MKKFVSAFVLGLVAFPCLAHATIHSLTARAYGKCGEEIAFGWTDENFAGKSVYEATSKLLAKVTPRNEEDKNKVYVESIAGLGEADEKVGNLTKAWGWNAKLNGIDLVASPALVSVPEGRSTITWTYVYLLMDENGSCDADGCTPHAGSPEECKSAR